MQQQMPLESQEKLSPKCRAKRI